MLYSYDKQVIYMTVNLLYEFMFSQGSPVGKHNQLRVLRKWLVVENCKITFHCFFIFFN